MTRFLLLIGLALGIGGILSPAWVTETARGYIREGIAPGLQFGRQIETEIADRLRSPQPDTVAQLQTELEAARRQTLKDKLEPHTDSEPDSFRDLPPLLKADMIRVRVLGHERNTVPEAALIVDAGTSSDVSAEQLVLGEDLLLDQGINIGLQQGEPVLTGGRILGRIRSVGPNTSRVQRVTDADFRGHVRVWKAAKKQFGADAVIEGAGGGQCQLKFVPADEPVKRGDLVCSAETNPDAEGVVIYGQIASVERSPDGSGRIILVDVNQPQAPGHVAILRRRVNPERALGN